MELHAWNQCTTSTTVDVATPDPSYTIAKVDFNSNDNDGQIWDLAFNDRDPNPVTGRDGDSQRLNVWDDAVFKIYVENTGNVALTNVEVTDILSQVVVGSEQTKSEHSQ